MSILPPELSRNERRLLKRVESLEATIQSLRSNHAAEVEKARRENDMLRRALEALAERGSPIVKTYVEQQIKFAEAARDQPVRETEIEQAVYQAMFTNVGEGDGEAHDAKE